MRGNTSGGIGEGYLKAGDFAKFLKSSPEVLSIDLSSPKSGEVFLNPDFPEIAATAAGRGVKLDALNGTNFNDVPTAALDAMVRHGLRTVTISMDGASEKTYGKYMLRGDFKKVVSNIEKLNILKKMMGSPLPHVNINYLILEHNHNPGDIADAVKLAERLGVGLTFVKDWGSYVPGNMHEIGKSANLSYSYDDIFKFHNNRREALLCSQILVAPIINWDGRLLGCGLNKYPFDLNAFELGLAACLKSDEVSGLLNAMSVAPSTVKDGCAPPYSRCLHCFQYRKMIENDRALHAGDFEGMFHACSEWLRR
jgi:hypothetical protein